MPLRYELIKHAVLESLCGELVGFSYHLGQLWVLAGIETGLEGYIKLRPHQGQEGSHKPPQISW